MINAVLFDLDGVLVDAVELHYISLNKAIEKVCGFTIERNDHIKNFNGLPTKKKLETLLLQGRIEEKHKKEIWDLKQEFTKETIKEVLKRDEVKIDMLKHLKKYSIKIACVTNSIYETAALMLHTTEQLNYIDVLIGNDVIRQPKPHAEGYIRAMIYFNTMPDNTLVVEDSEVGLKAAYASGANVMPVKGVEEVNLENLQKELIKYI